MKNLKDKVVVISGAGSGIGRALAIQMAKEGSKLALNDCNEVALKETISFIENQAVYSEVADVADREKIEHFAQNVIKAYGKVDVVINNAGVALAGKELTATAYEDFEWLMNINFWGTVYGTKAFLPFLLKEKEASLVNISSVFGLVGVAGQTSYCASKFAVRGFTESVRMEMTQKNVCVSSVHPGGIKTNIAKNSKGWEGIANKAAIIENTETVSFINTPAYAASVIIKGIQQKKEKILIGKDARFLDRLARVFPVNYSKILFKKLNGFNK